MFLHLVTTIAAGIGGGLIAWGVMHAGVALLDWIAPMPRFPRVEGEG